MADNLLLAVLWFGMTCPKKSEKPNIKKKNRCSGYKKESDYLDYADEKERNSHVKFKGGFKSITGDVIDKDESSIYLVKMIELDILPRTMVKGGERDETH